MHSDGPDRSGPTWLDGDAGPVVRPYALTGGRVEPTAGHFNLVAYVVAKVRLAPPPLDLQPEHHAILNLVRIPQTVAEVSSQLGLALSVTRVLLGDLVHYDLISINQPSPTTPPATERILKEVLDGLRAL